MIDLSTIPEWYPVLIVGAFGAGAALTKALARSVSKRECETHRASMVTELRIKELIKEQIKPVQDAIHYYNIERANVWESVRATERNVAVIMESLKWLKEKSNGS